MELHASGLGAQVGTWLEIPLSSAESSQMMLASGKTLQHRTLLISATACVTTAVLLALSIIVCRLLMTPLPKTLPRSCLAQSKAAVTCSRFGVSHRCLNMRRCSRTVPEKSLLLVKVVSWQGSSLADTMTCSVACFNVFGSEIVPTLSKNVLTVVTSLNHWLIEPAVSV